MDNTRRNQALEVAIAAARDAGVELKKHYGRIDAEAKQNNGTESGDIVTRLDRETETFLSNRFKAFDPTIGFRGEEFGVENHADITWLVDPIDGTSHFVRGLPFCTTMIALVDRGHVVLSVIHDFVNDQTYYAARGGGAFKNGQPIQVSDRPLNKAIVSFETRLHEPENLAPYLAVRGAVGGVIATINCGFEFAMIASGKLDGRITKHPYGMDWDFAPGSLLVQEAGGVITNHGSDKYDYTKHDFVAANPLVHAALTSGEGAVFKA